MRTRLTPHEEIRCCEAREELLEGARFELNKTAQESDAAAALVAEHDTEAKEELTGGPADDPAVRAQVLARVEVYQRLREALLAEASKARTEAAAIDARLARLRTRVARLQVLRRIAVDGARNHRLPPLPSTRDIASPSASSTAPSFAGAPGPQPPRPEELDAALRELRKLGEKEPGEKKEVHP